MRLNLLRCTNASHASSPPSHALEASFRVILCPTVRRTTYGNVFIQLNSGYHTPDWTLATPPPRSSHRSIPSRPTLHTNRIVSGVSITQLHWAMVQYKPTTVNVPSCARRCSACPDCAHNCPVSLLLHIYVHFSDIHVVCKCVERVAKSPCASTVVLQAFIRPNL